MYFTPSFIVHIENVEQLTLLSQSPDFFQREHLHHTASAGVVRIGNGSKSSLKNSQHSRFKSWDLSSLREKAIEQLI